MSVATLAVKELKPGFGAEILDVDVARAPPSELAGIVDAFQRHGAILLRDQKLEPDDLMAFIAAFGRPEGHTLGQFTLPGYPKIYILSNRTVDGVPIGAHNDGVGWHTDYSYKAEPVMCTTLYAVEVPPEGSDTLLADGCAAWNALPPERQAMLAPLKLHHSYQHFMATREFNAMDLPEEIRLLPQRGQVGDALPSVRQSHRQVHQDPSRVVAPPPFHQRTKRLRESLVQPAALRQFGQETAPGVAHQP